MSGRDVDGRGPEDYAQEAIAKVLAGERRRPPKVGLMTFLCATVQSLISHGTARLRMGDLGERAGREEEPSDLVARAELLRGAWIRVRRSLADDKDAESLLDALIAHWPHRDLGEIAEILHWTPERVRLEWRRIAYKVRSRAGDLKS